MRRAPKPRHETMWVKPNDTSGRFLKAKARGGNFSHQDPEKITFRETIRFMWDVVRTLVYAIRKRMW